jgi:glycosyltransferase involved in cell wall biosynthesis
MKSMAPNISVIVPIYNSEDYLVACLESLTHQTLNSIEIICVNDGSIDNSGKILEEYQHRDARISIINKANGGLSSARNEGIKAASGEYIAFIDSDDWIDQHYLEKLYQAAHACKADISMGNFRWFSNKSTDADDISWISKIINSIKSDIAIEPSEKKKIIETSSVCNKLFLREFIICNNFLFYEGLFWEDNPYTIMTSIKANKISIVRDVFYHCRQHEKSITGTAAYDRKPFDIFAIMTKLKHFFESENIDRKDGYQYYYAEILYLHYYYQLFDRIHKQYRKEFYYRVKQEFSRLEESNIRHLNNKYPPFKLINKNGYYFFVIMTNLKNIAYSTYGSLYKFYRKVRIVFSNQKPMF